MAYSDYGGYAYKNGERVVERSDAAITADMAVGTPGMYPGFSQELRECPMGHAILGSGPIYVLLYKQSSIGVYRNQEHIELLQIAVDPLTVSWEVDGKVATWIDDDEYRDSGKILTARVDGVTIFIRWIEDDNYYVNVALIEPDGTEWMGFSGYGVGAGLEDAGYGYSTADCESKLFDGWLEKAKEQDNG